MNKKPRTIPEFVTEQQERLYWERHDSTDHFDWSQAKKVTLPRLKPTIESTREDRPTLTSTARSGSRPWS